MILYIPAGIMILAIIVAAIFFKTAIVKQFNPDPVENAGCSGSGLSLIPGSAGLSFTTWNVGYCGLGAEMDFFYEGGEKVRPGRKSYNKYRNGVSKTLRSCTSGFILLQEVDRDSKRSYREDQHVLFSETMPEYYSCFSANYSSRFVPVPIFRPMGKVLSGLATFAHYNPVSAERISTPGSYSWPTRLFMPKRCFLRSRFATAFGKELVVFNLHNSAFEDAEALRKEELALLKKLLLEEYENKGNYVVAGGDWNQSPPGYSPGHGGKYREEPTRPLKKDYLPEGWTWAFDPGIPTNRDVQSPLSDTTRTTLIDFFVLSPNIELLEVETKDLGFADSDHHPVEIRVRLKEN
ncbi:MAG: hypothetical protein JXA03_15060 [Bacteroidales bacterium]|nr:hypothetical protein [Bacteroidales bacterium]